LNAAFVAVTVSGVVGTLQASRVFSFDVPLVSSAARVNAAVSGGSYVTVAGFGFGPTDVTLTVGLSRPDMATTTWTSTTSVVVASAEGPVGSLFDAQYRNSVLITVAGSIGTRQSAFTFDPPAISSSSSLNMATSFGLIVTISGLNFYRLDRTATASVAGSDACTSTTWSSSTTVACNFAAGEWSNAYNPAQVVAVTGTGPALFTFDAPVASIGATANSVLSGSAVLTISGLNFGGSATPSAFLNVYHSTAGCATTSWSSATTVSCNLKSSAASTNYQSTSSPALTIAQVVGTLLLGFTYDAPVFTQSAAYNAASTSGHSITLGGMNFANVDLTPTIRLGSTMCLTTTWQTSTNLLCNAPPASYGGGARQTIVTMAGAVGTHAGQLSYDGTGACAAVRRGTCSIMIACCCAQLRR
jgi:hypothetical protein